VREFCAEIFSVFAAESPAQVLDGRDSAVICPPAEGRFS